MRVKLFLLLFIVAITSEYCSAQEKAVPEPVLEGLRQQMKQLDTLQMSYSVTSTTFPSNKELKYEVSYMKSGDKYNMHELTYDGDEQIREKRYVYDEIEIKFFNYTIKFKSKENFLI